MDADYVRFGMAGDFELALSVLTTVISRPRPADIVTDGGTKSISFDNGPPAVTDLPGASLFEMHEEHAVLRLNGDLRLKTGDLVKLVPSHCCGTFNLHNEVFAMRGKT